MQIIVCSLLCIVVSDWLSMTGSSRRIGSCSHARNSSSPRTLRAILNLTRYQRFASTGPIPRVSAIVPADTVFLEVAAATENMPVTGNRRHFPELVQIIVCPLIWAVEGAWRSSTFRTRQQADAAT